ncbi:MAG: MFS transporter [Firmicutes bacterium]|nr:MFS transporter [Bacillota bacterium]
MWGLAIGQFLYALGDGFLYPFVAFYLTRNLHLPMATAGIFMGIAGIGYVLGQLPAGYLTDRFGPKSVAVMAYAVSGLSIIMAPIADRAWVWVIAYGLALTMTGVAYPAMLHAMTMNGTSKRRTQALSLLILAYNAGIIIGPLVGLPLALNHFSLIFWIDGSCLLASSLVLAMAVPSGLDRRMGPKVRLFSGKVWHQWLYLPPWQQSGFWSLALGGTLIGVIYSQLASTFPMEMGHTLSVLRWYGLLWAMNGALIAILQWPVSWLLQHRSRRFWMGLGAILYAMAMVVLGISAEVTMIVVAFFVVTMGELVYEPLPPGEYAEQAPKGFGARYQGAGSFFNALGMVIGPILGGLILSGWGKLGLWFLMGGLGLTAAVLIGHRVPQGRQTGTNTL